MINSKLFFAATFSVLLSACGGGGGGGDGGDNGGNGGPTNSSPSVVFSAPSSLRPGDSFSIPFTATDADGDLLTYKAQWVSPSSSPLSTTENVVSGVIPSDITANVTLGVLLSVSDGKATTNKTVNLPVIVSSSSPTIQIGSGLKTKVFGGHSFSAQYVVSDNDTPQSAIRVNAVSNSDKLTVTVDEQNKRIDVTASDTETLLVATVSVVATDGVNTGESSFTVSIMPVTPELSALESDIGNIKVMLMSDEIKREDLSFIDTLGVIALSKGTITPDDIEITKANIVSEHDKAASSALQAIADFESNISNITDPDNVTPVSSDFQQWKSNLLSNYAPSAVEQVNLVAQAASVSGLVDASVTKVFPYAESRFLGNPAYNNIAEGHEPWFKDAFIWMYATENGFGKVCLFG